ncbi:hypothetical protein SDC9_205352 [bioreactor metagenome]|uniref:Uncharacterized protein n=1 Tax=bioreactor metagenome TaxID=1076179 RepID=A0A645J1V2_9ZZZZ
MLPALAPALLLMKLLTPAFPQAPGQSTKARANTPRSRARSGGVGRNPLSTSESLFRSSSAWTRSPVQLPAIPFPKTRSCPYSPVQKARREAGKVRLSYFSSAASLRPMSTPMTEAIINPRVQPLESPSESNPCILVVKFSSIFTRLL